MSATVRLVLFYKVGSSPHDGSGGTCYFASEDITLPMGDRGVQVLGGPIQGAEARDYGKDRVAAVSNGASMIEIWERPSGFQGGKLDGAVINDCQYKRLASIDDVIAIRREHSS